MRSRHSKLCVLRQAGQYSPSRFLACHSNLLDPLSTRKTPCRSTGFYVYMHACVTVGLYHFTALVFEHVSVCAHNVHPSKNWSGDCFSITQTHTRLIDLWLQHCPQCVGSSAVVDLHMTCLCLQRSCSYVLKVSHS